MGSSSGSIGVGWEGVVVGSDEFSMDGGSGISTPSVVTMHTLVVGLGCGKSWYVPIKDGS
jgi:hypothetical protein